MNERHQQNIKEYLQQNDAQARILEHMQQARSNLTVTISRAARIFNFSESQLREWEKRGLLQTERPVLSAESKGVTGHRQYSLQELFKLAIIRDLIDQGYTPGEIPVDVEKLWEAAAGAQIGMAPGQPAQLVEESSRTRQLSIDARVENTDAQEFWRYFVTQALRLSLMLICEDMPDTVAGLVLSLEERNLAGTLSTPGDLKSAGRSLVGWLGQNGSFYLFLTDSPTFAFPTDYRLQTLRLADEATPAGDEVLDNTFIVLKRETRPSPLTPELREVVKRLLELIYQRVGNWEPALAYGTRDWLYQRHELEHAPQGSGDRVFNALLERVIELGGKTANGRDRWSFCALLLPNDVSLPLQQQSLIVQAQTRNSPFQIGQTTINPQKADQANTLSLKAFEGSQIVSLSAALPGDTMVSSHSVQVITSTPEIIANGQAGRLFQAPPPGETTHSALAVPVVGEFSISAAVFYVEANEIDAFSSGDQRVLLMISRMLGELLRTSRVRGQEMLRRETMLRNPAIVDPTFREFSVESDFIAEIDNLLANIQKESLAGLKGEEELSILSVDIDNQSSIAMKYGNRIARNLSQQVGLRIRRNMSSARSFQLFHVSADKYYVLLKGVALADASGMAKQLCNALGVGNYGILPISAISGRATPRENMLELSGVTAHIGVSSYTTQKLDELLKRYSPEVARIYVRTLILAGIEEMLERGKLKGGNCVVAWDRVSWDYKVLP